MNEVTTHDVELIKWLYHPPALGIHKGCYTGYIYNDTKERFTLIRTSEVVSVDGDILKTLNTTYKLGAPNEH